VLASARISSWQTVNLAAVFSLLFTAQPEAPAVVLADASGWAVNDSINNLPTRCG
jgi:hypothetical protein